MADLYYQDPKGVHHRLHTPGLSIGGGEVVVETACGKTQTTPYDRVNQASTQPGGERCPKCFGKEK